jgi:hypothetical protein
MKASAVVIALIAGATGLSVEGAAAATRGWQRIRLQLGKVSSARLNGLAARSASDAWAVGSAATNRRTLQPLTLHWNGRRWNRVVAAPVPGFGDVILPVTGADPYPLVKSCCGRAASRPRRKAGQGVTDTPSDPGLGQGRIAT